MSAISFFKKFTLFSLAIITLAFSFANVAVKQSSNAEDIPVYQISADNPQPATKTDDKSES
ncbi:hypothetical protein CKF54_07670 [Psittacicella hinzii]|uniref:Uncharacterized protein n=1 Tax=Psittacicella hinzii TaxID=2028575 RepID=A0A3A1Y1D4_9GAMM|nr:hypothetical protein [Psittacicella hinzii]RIY31099.1 hypothetical protein CKF54_07670 [Psittacicella hinzii]